MPYNFTGKRVLVTGAGQGIGREISLELAKCGAHVLALSRSKDGLETLKAENPEIQIVQCDVSDWSKTEAIVKGLGDIDLCVNNAGVSKLQDVGSITEDVVKFIFDINVNAPINISQIVANNLKKRGVGGSIVNISSVASSLALPQHTAYCSSKAALDSVTKVMALELGPFQIRVNSVNPTVVLTEMGRKAWGEESISNAMKAKIPLGTFCECDDVVKAVLFLLSDDAKMITGVHLRIDGGYAVQ